ncbi:lipid asymmetry maintenance protein MlaB [Legionella sp. km772]|uniref:STAS domain-containing protein n=1 Tax=Legionella sp. km772 TaxID=2498111 RepID=UPI000F8E04B9|nr:STAS domain-containing protein [Legionella sp. km772]RUR08962.1 anti-sigma factor antagonist [Legionella sp. km772]
MNTTHFKPGHELTFHSVITVRNQLIKFLKADNNAIFCLDLTEVNQCDSAGLALLIEAKKLCKQYNKQFEVVGISAKTLSLAEFCGVNQILEPA